MSGPARRSAATYCERCDEIHPFMRDEKGVVVTIMGARIVLCPRVDARELVFVPARFDVIEGET